MNDKIIQTLIEKNIINLSTNNPYRFESGILSPIYTDLRLTISYPELRNKIAKGLAEIVKNKFPEATVIGGVATAGIPHASWVADELNLPLIYVRSKPKDHGAGKQIEGKISKTDKVVLIDDLISTGGSVLKATKAVNDNGNQVIGILSIFSYQFPDSTQNFNAAKIPFEPLLTYSDVIEKGKAENQFTSEEYQKLSQLHEDPWKWTKERSND